MADFGSADTSSILVGLTKIFYKVVYINWLDYWFWEPVVAGSSPVTATNIAL